MSLSDESVCGFAGWAFDKMLRDVAPRLRDERILAEFDRAARGGVGRLNLRELTTDELRALGAVLRSYYSEVRDDPNALASPEFLPGYLGTLDELIRMLDDAGR